MENQNAYYLYETLKQIAQGKFKQELDLTLLSADFQQVGEAINYIGKCVEELNQFALHMAMGNLDAPVPSRSNYLGGRLKELHSMLSHLTWQAQQVTKGDYSQRVDFMGEFSDAFNTMIVRLEEREQQLKSEIEKNKLRAKATQESNKFLLALVDGIENWVLVTDAKTGDILFTNRVAREAFIEMNWEMTSKYAPLLTEIKNYHEGAHKGGWEICLGEDKRTFAVESYAIQWSERQAYAHLIQDVTNRKRKDREMIRLVYQDTLTGVYNRRFGEEQLDQLILQKEAFCLCYVDLDGLKYVNDHFGHQEGDVYICQVAEALIRFSRSSDLVCRIGGDEFMVILKGCNETQGKDKMEKIDEALFQQSAAMQKPYPFSISYGIATVGGQEKDLTAAMVLQMADEKMYAFKREQKTRRAE